MSRCHHFIFRNEKWILQKARLEEKMPNGTRKQINIRIDSQTEALLPQLRQAITKAIGLDVGHSDLFRMGLQELTKKYLPARPSDETGASIEKAKKAKKPKKE
jgi:hypothetical protein